MAQKTNILLLGATGYIGGSILTQLLKSQEENNKEAYTITALVRKVEQVERLQELGVRGVLFESLDDGEGIRGVVSGDDGDGDGDGGEGGCDVIIAAASARHEGAARACIEGLAERKRRTGREGFYIHTTGGSALGDYPESGGRVDTAFHSDRDEDIYALEGTLEEGESPTRRVNQMVVQLGLERGVRTYVVSPALIFGWATGPFTQGGGDGQVNWMVQLALARKQAVVAGSSGTAMWSRVHIEDLSKLYVLLVEHIHSGPDAVPSGKKGYYFAENGAQSWKSLAERIGAIGKRRGVFESEEVGSASLKEVADMFSICNGDVKLAEGVLACNARTKADHARDVLSWQPAYGDDALEKYIEDVVVTMSKEVKK